jgi:methylated-DNA-[protein]-cysteine S-methyltransferase
MILPRYQATITTPVGKLGISTSDTHLLGVHFLHDDPLTLKPKTLIAKETVEQLLCYFADPHFIFELPFMLSNLTHFEQRLLETLQKIPTGTTQPYAKIAESLSTHARPIGNACRKNPIPIIIPCHRVVSSQDLGGYHGQTKGPLLEIKRWLLRHEGCDV